MTVPAVTPLGVIIGRALEVAAERVATLPSLSAGALRGELMRTAVSSQVSQLAVGEGSIHRALASLDKLILAGGPDPSATALLRDTAREHAQDVLHAANSAEHHRRPRSTSTTDPSPDPGAADNRHKRRRSTLYPY
jgi:predicted RNA methylase